MYQQLWSVFLLIVAAMMGCGDDADEQKARFINSIPANGSEIASDQTIVLSFDHPPGMVTVNHTHATTEGKQATWKAQGLISGQEVKLEVQWETGKAILTFQIKVKDDEPPFVVEVTIPHRIQGPIPHSGCHFLYTKQVTSEIGRFLCHQNGVFFCGDWPSDLSELEGPLDPRPSLEVPFEPALKYGDTLVVDTNALNVQGIEVKFSEPIQSGETLTQIKGGREVPFLPVWKYDSVGLFPTKAYEFENDTTYVIELIVHDGARHELRAKIQFHTS